MKKGWRYFKEIFGDLLIIGFGGFMAWMFLDYRVEPNPYYRWAEFSFALLIAGLGIERLVRDIRG